MRMVKRSTALILLLAAFLTLPVLAADSPTLLNGALEGDGVPEGWEVYSYQSQGYSVSAENGVVTLSAYEEDDLRLTQLVEVEENTAYVLSAQVAGENIRGGRGATLSIDNYSLDGCYIYSDSILGSGQWVTVELPFRTGEGQTTVIAALRLGGYSELSTGTARFRDVKLTLAGEGVYARPLTAGGSPVAQDEAKRDQEEFQKIQWKSYLHLFIVLSVVVGVALLFGFYRNRKRLGAIPLTRGQSRKYFVLLVFAGLALRSVLAAAWGGHDTDMGCWIGWGNYIAREGTATFYTAPGHEWYDYPPGYMLVLGLIAGLIAVLGIPSGSWAETFAYIFPAYLADVGIAALLMRCARKNGLSEGWCLLLGGLTVFNPAAVVLSGAWGQIDSILTLFLLLSFVSLTEGKRIPAGVFYGLAVMVKWQALIFGPVLAAAYLLSVRSRRDALETAGAVLGALAVIFALSLPFKGDQGPLWIVDRFFSAAGGYDYASIEAYNFLALCGGNWTPASAPLVFGVSFRTVGTVSIVLAVLLSLYFLWRMERPALSGGRPGGGEPAALFITAAFCMYMIFTFGHYMHERYVFPVIFLLYMAFILSRNEKFLLSALLLSAVLFLNEITAMYVISEPVTAVVRGSSEHQAVVTVCSGLETLSFLLFAGFTAAHVFRDTRKGGAVHG